MIVQCPPAFRLSYVAIVHASSYRAIFILLLLLLLLLLFTAIGLLPGGSSYFTCKQNMKLVTTKFKSGGLHEKHIQRVNTSTCWDERTDRLVN